jgi:hypothetical protein
METQAIEQTVNLQRIESIIQLIRSLPIAERPKSRRQPIIKTH